MFVARARSLERVLDGKLQFVEVDRLADKIVSAQLERGLHVIELRIGGDHDDRGAAAVLLELIEHLDAGQVGQAYIEKHEVGRFALGEPQCSFAGVWLRPRNIPTLRTSDEATISPGARRRRSGLSGQASVLPHFLRKQNGPLWQQFGAPGRRTLECAQPARENCIDVIPDTWLDLLKGVKRVCRL